MSDAALLSYYENNKEQSLEKSLEKKGEHKHMVLMEELLAVMATIGVVATAQETNLDNLMLAWSLAGSVGAALASLALWEPETPRARIGMFAGNCLIGLLFGPFVETLLASRVGMNINMANCLAVSGALSLSTFGLFKPLWPILSKAFISKFEKWFGQKLDENFPTQDKGN